MYEGEAPQAVIHTEAKANASDNEVGIEARYRFVLPKGRCYRHYW
jgi:hypothetical protein